jgi:hypothetical protein
MSEALPQVSENCLLTSEMLSTFASSKRQKGKKHNKKKEKRK